MLKKIWICSLLCCLFTGCAKTNMTSAQSEAVEEADRLVNEFHFSKAWYLEDMADEMDEKEYDAKDLEWALNYLEDEKKIQWQEVAYQAAIEEIDSAVQSGTDFYSRKTLKDYLVDILLFTSEEADYALDKGEKKGTLEWNRYTVTAGKMHVSDFNISKAMLIQDLQDPDLYAFTKEQAEFAADYLTEKEWVDWNQEAVDYGMDGMRAYDNDKEAVEEIWFLPSGFTEEQIAYAMKYL